ncbi:MAG: hypothetical protein IPH49_01765 [Ignavibacteria bacterium]|nr:hypothetical protein [Ignavibacteria bacterium]
MLASSSVYKGHLDALAVIQPLAHGFALALAWEFPAFLDDETSRYIWWYWPDAYPPDQSITHKVSDHLTVQIFGYSEVAADQTSIRLLGRPIQIYLRGRTLFSLCPSSAHRLH